MASITEGGELFANVSGRLLARIVEEGLNVPDARAFMDAQVALVGDRFSEIDALVGAEWVVGAGRVLDALLH